MSWDKKTKVQGLIYVHGHFETGEVIEVSLCYISKVYSGRLWDTTFNEISDDLLEGWEHFTKYKSETGYLVDIEIVYASDGIIDISYSNIIEDLKQMKPKVQQCYIEKPIQHICVNCKHFVTERTFPDPKYPGYWKDVNTCGLGNFKVKIQATCNLFLINKTNDSTGND